MVRKTLKTISRADIRKNVPRRERGNKVGQIFKNRRFETSFEVVEGEECEEIEGNDIWYRIGHNLYVWSGHFEPLDNSRIALEEYSGEDCWWHRDFSIPELWTKGLSGNGVSIAVLDTGLSLPHPDLILERAQLEDVTASDPDFSTHWEHGTHTIGIIAASNNGFGVKGIAYNGDFWFGKLKHNRFGDKIEYLVKGLKWALAQEVDIVSVSMGFCRESRAMAEAVARLRERDVLLVCAAGNREISQTDEIAFPARYPETLSVGGLRENGTPLENTINAGQTDLFAPGEEILSTDKNKNYSRMSGSSQATPFVAGVAALWLEQKRIAGEDIRPNSLKNQLIETGKNTDFGTVINPPAILD